MSATTVRRTVLRVPAADLGPESPLAPFSGLQRLPDPARSSDLPVDMRERMAYGRLSNPLPYAVQNGYRRELRPRELPAIELANDRLQALVLPTLGGRLWSLRELGSDRDLVFRNPRLQFANLALTDAWFAGGIEWNLGSTGHAATTSRPVFAGTVASDRGTVLRIWEWERTRDLAFSVDLLMPADRPVLLAIVRVRNPDPEPKPLYWWTNMAVPEEPGVRVVAPAVRAWRTAYDGALTAVDIPFADDPRTDVSFPLNARRSVDYFVQVPRRPRPWIAAVRADGTGLAQTSTAELRGRKLFCWGTGAGGRHWQEWLCGPASAYLEIQAGLATTQLEHLQLPAGAEISWAEAYAPIEPGSAALDGSWAEAVAAVEQSVAAVMSGDELDIWHGWWRAEVADAAPEQLAAGSGAGQAELLVRGRNPESLPGIPFARPLADGFRHLVTLTQTGQVDQDAAGAEVLVPPTGDRWAPLLSPGAGWWSALMTAIRAQARGQLDAAELGYLRSNELKATPWAARGLASLALSRGDFLAAAQLYGRAVAQARNCLPLLVEAADALLAGGRASDCLALLDAAPKGLAGHGRVTLQRIRALLAVGNVEDARTVFLAGFEVPDLREGETLGDLWSAAFGELPLPYQYDFRM
jgi:hypothetical protein